VFFPKTFFSGPVKHKISMVLMRCEAISNETQSLLFCHTDRQERKLFNFWILEIVLEILEIVRFLDFGDEISLYFSLDHMVPKPGANPATKFTTTYNASVFKFSKKMFLFSKRTRLLEAIPRS
jgi:hypothetical protein